MQAAVEARLVWPQMTTIRYIITSELNIISNQRVYTLSDSWRTGRPPTSTEDEAVT